MLARGLKKGERVAVINHNAIELLEVYFGAIKAGGIAVPINIHLAAQEWEEIFRDIEPMFLIIGKDYLKKLEQVEVSSRPWQSLFVIHAGEGNGLPDYESLICGATSDRLEIDAQNTDTALIILTSGTTGKPKGVMLLSSKSSCRCLGVDYFPTPDPQRYCPGNRAALPIRGSGQHAGQYLSRQYDYHSKWIRSSPRPGSH